jgi:chromosome segregation ATPase
MIEPIMYFAIGFFVAALFGLLFVPLVHNRAVRLTMRRLEAATPLSIAEIRADKDQLRAEFAMSTRRLEMSVEQMKAKTTSQLAELGKKSDAINQLKKELGEKTATIFALEARDKSIKDQLHATEEEFEIKTGSLREAERTLADKEAELSKLLAELGERSITADSQRVELAALRTQVEAMKVSVSDYERAVQETEFRLDHERRDAETASKELADARSKVESLATRTAQLERQLVVQTTEAEILSRRVQELEARLSDQGRLLAEREYEAERLRTESDTARKAESELRTELAATTGRGSAAADKFRSEIMTLEAQLAAAVEERARLQREVGTMKRDAEATWAAERVENALLRERINDVAAEVARLTAALEGPGSPINTILASEPPRPHPVVNGTSSVNGTNKGEAGPAKIAESPQDSRGTLADRIRALQTRASRVASSN